MISDDEGLGSECWSRRLGGAALSGDAEVRSKVTCPAGHDRHQKLRDVIRGFCEYKLTVTFVTY